MAYQWTSTNTQQWAQNAEQRDEGGNFGDVPFPHHCGKLCGFPDAPNTAKVRMNEMTWVPPSNAAATI